MDCLVTIKKSVKENFNALYLKIRQLMGEKFIILTAYLQKVNFSVLKSNTREVLIEKLKKSPGYWR